MSGPSNKDRRIECLDLGEKAIYEALFDLGNAMGQLSRHQKTLKALAKRMRSGARSKKLRGKRNKDDY